MKTAKHQIFSDLCASYNLAQRRYDRVNKVIDGQISELEAKIANLRRTKDRIKYPHFIEKIVRPIGEAMLAAMPDRDMRFMDVLGPFGLSCEVSIHFYKMGVSGKTKFSGDNCRSITFRHDDKRGVALVDRRKDARGYKTGSLGELNGLNHPTVEIPDSADAKWFLRWMKRQGNR